MTRAFALAAWFPLVVVSVCPVASEAEPARKAAATRAVPAAQGYALDLKGCPIAFQTRSGGAVAMQSTDDASGYFTHPAFARNVPLNISFDCVTRPAIEHCPTLALAEAQLGSQAGERPTTWQVMRVQHYAPINRRYVGEAFASNLTAVPRPRQRVLSFCLGDERRSIVGQSVVGTERQDASAAVLALLQTLRFSDEAAPPR